MRLLLVLFVLLQATAWAAEPKAPKHLLVTRVPYGSIYCDDACSFVPSEDGRSFAVSSPEGPVRVTVGDAWTMIQTPKHQLRIREKDGELLVQLDLKSYKILRKPNEVTWQFPDDKVFFRVHEGWVRDVVGSRGSLQIRRNVSRNTYEVSSEAGVSQVQLLKKGVRLVEGEPVNKHAYFVKGVAFRNGRVGIFIPLPGKLLSALDSDAVRTVTFVEPPPGAPPTEPAGFSPERPNPLKADPATPGILNAPKPDRTSDPLGTAAKKNEPPSAEDPLGTRPKMNPKYDRNSPLKANIPPKGSEDPLKVKEYDPLAPSSTP